MKIGIDLGTTNSAMAHLAEEGDIEIIQNDEGKKTTPSVVLIEEDGTPTVGEAASGERLLHPDRILERTKQDIDTEEDVTYDIDGTEYTPVRAASYILGKLKSDAEKKLDRDIDGAVITVPYYFGDRGRRATKDAAELAGFEPNEVKILNEPTAACLAYIQDNDIEGNVLVYDFGGGTFDATLAEVGSNINVISTEGDDELGGENIDDALYDHVRQQLVDDGYPDPNDTIAKKDQLRDELKTAKHALSSRPKKSFTYDTGEGMEKIELTREEFNDIVDDLIGRTIDRIEALFEKESVQEAGITRDDIDNVLLVGGSTRIPLVRERVEEFFGQEPKHNADPDTIVAQGAAIQAAKTDDEVEDETLQGLKTVILVDVLSHSLGVETDDGTFDKIFDVDTEIMGEVTNTKRYSNPADSQAHIIVHAVQKGEQGEPVEGTDAESLGDFVIQNVPADAKIDVTFSIDMDGTLQVEAETTEGQAGEMTIDEQLGLSQEEKERMMDGEDGAASATEEFGPQRQQSEGDD